MLKNRIFNDVLPLRVDVEAVLEQNFGSTLSLRDILEVMDPDDASRICKELASNTLSLQSQTYFDSVEARDPALKTKFVNEKWETLRAIQEESLTPVIVLRSMLDHFNKEIAPRCYGTSDSDPKARELGGWLVGGLTYSAVHEASVYVICGLIICPQTAQVDHHDDLVATPFFNWLMDRQKKLACLGWIHTHPNKTSEPSTADLSMYYNRLVGPQVSRVFLPEALMVVCQRKTTKAHVDIAAHRLSPFGLHVIGHQLQFYEELQRMVATASNASNLAKSTFKSLMYVCQESHRPYWPIMGDVGTHKNPVLKSNTPCMYYRVGKAAQLTSTNMVLINNKAETKQLGDKLAKEYHLGVPFFILDYGEVTGSDSMDYKIWIHNSAGTKFEETSIDEFKKVMEADQEEPNWKLWTPADF